MRLHNLFKTFSWFLKAIETVEITASEAERSKLAELASLRKARELLFNVLGFEQAISRKICILGIWSIDVISVCFHLNIKGTS